MRRSCRWIIGAMVGGLFPMFRAAEMPSGPITVFVAKKIMTMDPGLPEETAVTVRDGRILSVGSLEDLQPWIKNSPHKIDRTFAHKILLSGFIEVHGHPVIGHIVPASESVRNEQYHVTERHSVRAISHGWLSKPCAGIHFLWYVQLPLRQGMCGDRMTTGEI